MKQKTSRTLKYLRLENLGFLFSILLAAFKKITLYCPVIFETGDKEQ